ncbi:medium-chain fatty acid-CoA ligase faa2 [Coemansia sp. RSA 2336]|nr:medium-chain fatty acid-CoA ligase faa2 [Coemansia sp. RSA 2336]
MESYKVPSSELPGFSAIYRNPYFKDGACSEFYSDITTVYDLFRHNVTKYPEGELLGMRKLVSHKKTPVFGGYEWMTGKQAADFVEEFGTGLEHVYTKYASSEGTQASSAQQPLGIYSVNRPEWILTEIAGFRSRKFSVGISDANGVLSAEHMINDSKVSVVVCSMDKIPRILERIGETPTLKVIVCMDKLDCSRASLPTLAFNAKAVQELKARAESLGLAILDIDEVRQMGKDKPTVPTLPEPDDTCTISYTSGSTSSQKGVMVSHRAIVHSTKAFVLSLSLEDETYMPFMPLSHISGRISTYTMLYSQGHLGFMSEDITKVMDDVRELKPTLILVVPRLLNRIYERIAAATVQAKGLVGMLSRAGLKSKTKRIDSGRGTKHRLWDRLVFDKVAKLFGGRVKRLTIGASKHTPEVMSFFRAALSCDVINIYGQTENAAAGTILVNGLKEADNVGVPQPGVDVRLRSIPEMGYEATDADCPRGEIMIRGPCVFSRYQNNPEETQNVKTDGWLHTGDIGQINANGTLSIIDRAKNLFKTGRGVWVAPEPIEIAYSTSPLVKSVFVHGDQEQRDVVGVVVPDSTNFVPWAQKFIKRAKIDVKPMLSELCANQEVVSALLESLNRHVLGSGFTSAEHIKAIVCDPMPFESNPAGFYNASAKIRRSAIETYYKEQLEDIFAGLNNSTAPTLQEE